MREWTFWVVAWFLICISGSIAITHRRAAKAAAASSPAPVQPRHVEAGPELNVIRTVEIDYGSYKDRQQVIRLRSGDKTWLVRWREGEAPVVVPGP